MNDDELRRAWQAAMKDAPATADPVTEEELLALVERRGGEATRLAILDRVMASETARREFELLRAAASAGRAVKPAPRPRRWIVPVLAAAAVALVAVTLTITRRPPPPQFRGPGGEAVSLLAPWDGAEVPGAAGTRFEWRAVPGVERYRIEVLDSDQAVVFEAEPADTEAVTDRALPPGSYLWRVEARLRDGTRRFSPVRRLTVPEGAQ